jgi:hypothetical protein
MTLSRYATYSYPVGYGSRVEVIVQVGGVDSSPSSLETTTYFWTLLL